MSSPHSVSGGPYAAHALSGALAAARASRNPRSSPAPAPAPARTDWQLAGVIGSQLADPLAAMQHVLQEFDRTQNISGSQMQLLKLSLDSARDVARKSQQITRLAGGRLRQSHERLRLDELLRDALLARTKAFQQRGVELHHSLRTVEVIVDAALLSSLMDAALDWALSMGSRLVVTLGMKNWPEHGMLTLKASESVSYGAFNDDRQGGDTLGWYLLSEIARAMGVSVDRVNTATDVSLTIEFPRTVKHLEGLTAVELDTEGDSISSEFKPLAGHRLLVITQDEKLRLETLAVTRQLGLEVTFTPSTAKGMRFCEGDMPHLVIIDERLRDAVFDELQESLRKLEPNFPFIEIASKANTFEVADWTSASMTRVSHDCMRAQMPHILTMELAKMM